MHRFIIIQMESIIWSSILTEFMLNVIFEFYVLCFLKLSVSYSQVKKMWR